MALSTKLVMRQGQSLVMTPQLLQAIKLLQFSNQELVAFVEEELERNPLLERAEDATDPTPTPSAEGHGEAELSETRDFNEASEAEWSTEVFRDRSRGLGGEPRNRIVEQL